MYVYFENLWVCLSSITKWNSIFFYMFFLSFFCMCINCVYLYFWLCLYSIVLSFNVPHIPFQMWFERINLCNGELTDPLCDNVMDLEIWPKSDGFVLFFNMVVTNACFRSSGLFLVLIFFKSLWDAVSRLCYHSVSEVLLPLQSPFNHYSVRAFYKQYILYL